MTIKLTINVWYAFVFLVLLGLTVHTIYLTYAIDRISYNARAAHVQIANDLYEYVNDNFERIPAR